MYVFVRGSLLKLDSFASFYVTEMDETAAKKFYPSVEELNKVNSLVHCPEKDCTGVFYSTSNLNLHLAKTHKKEHLLKNVDAVREYYCPETDCLYNKNKFFKSMKCLKQHYLKVHSEKKFVCDICCKGFSTQASKNAHVEYCGVVFKCLECYSSYPSYESLVTHGRRKKHNILEKSLFKMKDDKIVEAIHKLNEKSSSNTCINKIIKRGECILLPKGSVSLQILNSYDKIALDKSSQTEIKLKRNVNKSSPDEYSNRETQTLKGTKFQTSTETQTIGDYTSRKTCNINSDENRKSIKTQTQEIMSSSKSCNTSFNLNDFDFSLDIKVERNSSSTQTVAIVPIEQMYSTTSNDFEFMNTSSQTNLNESMDTFDSDTFFNCNSQTQTDFILENDLLSTDYYTNMYTQTCDDILLHDLGFNNTHTQTVLDEMLRSVESQTMMSHNIKNLMSCHDRTHMETQTEIEFNQILEEINA